ncbi:MAG: hypothetical protein WD872_11815 [Pirellulaceae bacterium]
MAAVAKAFGEGTSARLPVPLELVVFAELLAGFTLLFHRTRPLGRGLVGIFFLVLAGFAMSAAAAGKPACDCLGELRIAPGWMAALDLFAASWLLAGCLLAGVASPVRREILRKSSAHEREIVANQTFEQSSL